MFSLYIFTFYLVNNFVCTYNKVLILSWLYLFRYLPLDDATYCTLLYVTLEKVEQVGKVG